MIALHKSVIKPPISVGKFHYDDVTTSNNNNAYALKDV